jgi:hypothetical protein
MDAEGLDNLKSTKEEYEITKTDYLKFLPTNLWLCIQHLYKCIVTSIYMLDNYVTITI